MNKIHPTAVIDKGCELGDGITVGPYAVIGDKVKIGDNCEIHNNVTLVGPTTIGEKCRIFPYSVVGGDSQDKKFDRSNTKARLTIGQECVIREHCTINRGSWGDDPCTSIGRGCLILAYCHIAHDCVLGDNVIFSNNSTLAGHVVIGKGVVLGGLVAIHQFVEIGPYCMVASRSLIKSNVPPYLTIQGQEMARAVTINKVGLRRNQFSEAEITDIEKAFRIYYKSKDLLKKDALIKLKEKYSDTPVICPFIDFVEKHENCVTALDRRESNAT